MTRQNQSATRAETQPPKRGRYIQAVDHLAMTRPADMFLPAVDVGGVDATNMTGCDCSDLPKYFYYSVINEETGKTEEYRHLIKGTNAATWRKSFANELGRLTQGVGDRMKSGTETLFFIRRYQVPDVRKVTYGRLVVSILPKKEDTHRVRLTVGGNLID